MIKRTKSDAQKRDGSTYALLPHIVLFSENYVALSYQAKALLTELALQIDGKNNGDLDLTQKRMALRGWPSNHVLYRARNELIERGFIVETVKGKRPNKASLYAVTWRDLDHCDGKLELAESQFPRSAYQRDAKIESIKSKRRVHKKTASASHGVEDDSIAPCEALETPPTTPYEAPMRPIFERSLPRTEHSYLCLPSDAERAAVNA